MEPRSHRVRANGLEHHVLEWGAEAGPVALLVHGFQDTAATFDDVAERLAAAGLRVVAPDMRGFGDAPWIAPGAYYYFPDYVADLAAIVSAHLGDAPLLLVGHSMGATIVTYFAGALPERVTKLALVDGVGPIDNPPDVAPVRMRRWLDDLERVRRKGEAMQRFASTAEAVARLQLNHPGLDEAILRRRAAQLVASAGDALRWKFDPLHRTTSPIPFFGASYNAFARSVACPVLHVSGGPRGHHVPDEEERLASFARLTRVTIDGGHMLHWTKPRELADALVDFWRAGS